MKNLVIGAAQICGDWNSLEPFVTSCKKNCSNADLVLYLDNSSRFTENKLKLCGVKVRQIPQKFRDDVINKRWIMFKDFLTTHTEYEIIFATDVRDVVFQGDIFSTYTEQKNFLAYSTFGYKIKDEPRNVEWIKNNFGEDEVKKIEDNIVAGASMFYGTYREIMILCEHIEKFLRPKTDWGDDQAITNYLIYNKILPIEDIFVSSPENGEFINLDYLGNKFSYLNKKTFEIFGDKFQRLDGGIPKVIHQWNLLKFPEIIQLVNMAYREEKFHIDKKFTDIPSAVDQMYCLIQRRTWGDDARFLQKCILNSSELSLHTEKLLKLREVLRQNYIFDN